MSPRRDRLEVLEALLTLLDDVRDKIAREVDVLAEVERRADRRRLRVVR